MGRGMRVEHSVWGSQMATTSSTSLQPPPPISVSMISFSGGVALACTSRPISATASTHVFEERQEVCTPPRHDVMPRTIFARLLGGATVTQADPRRFV